MNAFRLLLVVAALLTFNLQSAQAQEDEDLSLDKGSIDSQFEYVFDKSGNYTLGLKEQLIFPEIEYDDVDQIQGFTITIVMDHGSPKYRSESIDKILNCVLWHWSRGFSR